MLDYPTKTVYVQKPNIECVKGAVNILKSHQEITHFTGFGILLTILSLFCASIMLPPLKKMIVE